MRASVPLVVRGASEVDVQRHVQRTTASARVRPKAHRPLSAIIRHTSGGSQEGITTIAGRLPSYLGFATRSPHQAAFALVWAASQRQ